MKTILLFSIMTAMTALFSMPVMAKPKTSPNFIIIYVDDMGYGDLSVTGATGYRTPNIDRLCADGMRFTHYYSPQPICSASRAGLMTGCYPNRVGIHNALGPHSNIGLDISEETIADVLKKKDYVCGAVGKWHLGERKEFLPVHNGFDEYLGLPYSNDMWTRNPGENPKLPLIEGDSIIRYLTKETLPELTTMYTDRAVQFINKNADRPFFLYLAHSMPHVPLAVSVKFKGKSEQGLFGDVMMEIDWSVGEILKALKMNGIDKNTLLIFTSDNGPWINYGNHAGSTGGLREGKATTFDGGLRVPCIMYWPGSVTPGIVCNQLASGIDMLPTLADICGAPLPVRKIDGVSLKPFIDGDMKATPRKYFLYYFKKNNLEAVRDARFKLVFEHPGRTYTKYLPGIDGTAGKLDNNHLYPMALYDMRRDPGEWYDVQEQNPDVVERLMKIAEEAKQDLGDDLTGRPGENRRPAGK